MHACPVVSNTARSEHRSHQHGSQQAQLATSTAAPLATSNGRNNRLANQAEFRAFCWGMLRGPAANRNTPKTGVDTACSEFARLRPAIR